MLTISGNINQSKTVIWSINYIYIQIGRKTYHVKGKTSAFYFNSISNQYTGITKPLKTIEKRIYERTTDGLSR